MTLAHLRFPIIENLNFFDDKLSVKDRLRLPASAKFCLIVKYDTFRTIGFAVDTTSRKTDTTYVVCYSTLHDYTTRVMTLSYCSKSFSPQKILIDPAFIEFLRQYE